MKLRRLSQLWNRPKPARSIDQFIIEGSSTLCATEIEAIYDSRPELRKKLKRVSAFRRFSGLRDQVRFLLQVIEVMETGREAFLLPVAYLEGLFALGYLLKDDVRLSKGGLTDDAVIVSAVLKRNRKAFLKFCKEQNISWPGDGVAIGV